MKQQKNNFILCIVLIQFFFIYSSNEFPQISDNTCNTSQHTINFDNYHNINSSNKVIVSCGVKELPNTSYMYRANHSIINSYGSAEFKNHFVTVITSLMYEVAIENYRIAIPGYTSAHGLRDCINALSTFTHSILRTFFKKIV